MNKYATAAKIEQRASILKKPKFLVNLVDRNELDLLEELLCRNSILFVKQSAAKRGRTVKNTMFELIGTDVFVDADQYEHAASVLADYNLGWDMATKDVSKVPAARSDRLKISAPTKKYPTRLLVLSLLAAAVLFSTVFLIGFKLMYS